MSLLENLAGQKYILLTFIEEWLSVTDLGCFLVSSFSKKSQYPTLFANYEHNIIQKFFEMAKISHLKAFMHKSICSKFFSAISQNEEIRTGIYQALTHPDADPEYRSLAVTFLSGCAFTFVLPNDEHGKEVNRLFFLDYGVAFSDIDSQVIFTQFKQRLDDLQDKVEFIIDQGGYTYGSEDEEAGNESENARVKEADSAVIMVHSIAHKLNAAQAKLLILQLFKIFEDARDYWRWGHLSKHTLEMLSVLAINYQVKKIIELIKWLTLFCRNAIELPSGSWDIVTKIFSKYSSTIDSGEFEKFAFVNDDLFGDMIRSIGAASLWKVFNDTQRNTLKNRTLQLLCKNDYYYVSFLKEAISLWHAFDEAQRAMIKESILNSLNNHRVDLRIDVAAEAILLWQVFSDAECDFLKHTMLGLLNANHPSMYPQAICATALLWQISGDMEVQEEMLSFLTHADFSVRRMVIDKFVSLSSAFNRAQCDVVKVLCLNDINEDVPLNALKMLVSLWGLLNPTQRNTVKNKILLFLDATYFYTRLAAVEMAVALWQHFSPDEQTKIIAVASEACQYKSHTVNYVKLRDAAQKVIISFVVKLDDKQLKPMITRLIGFLEGDSEELRIRGCDILMAIICHHPDYPYELEALSSPVLKDYFSRAIETVRTMVVTLQVTNSSECKI